MIGWAWLVGWVESGVEGGGAGTGERAMEEGRERSMRVKGEGKGRRMPLHNCRSIRARCVRPP